MIVKTIGFTDKKTFLTISVIFVKKNINLCHYMRIFYDICCIEKTEFYLPKPFVLKKMILLKCIRG